MDKSGGEDLYREEEEVQQGRCLIGFNLSLCFICCASILQPTSLGKESLSPRQHSDVDFISHILSLNYSLNGL